MFHNKLYNHLELHWEIKYNFDALQTCHTATGFRSRWHLINLHKTWKNY